MASIMAEVNDKHSGVVGEKSTYAIDASGQKGDVSCLNKGIVSAFTVY